MKYFVILTGFIVLLYVIGFPEKTKQSYFMDRDFTTAIKGFAILTVVWAHTGARLNIGGIQFIAGVGVVLFLICSGYGLEMSYQKNGLKGFWKKRILGVCVPFWIVELIGLLITGRFTIEKYLMDFFFIRSATAYGWFMQYIVICYIVFFVVKVIVERTKLNENAMLIAAFTFWFIIDSCFFANPDMPFLKARQMFSFPFGVMIARNKGRIEDLVSSKKAPALILGGGIGTSVHGNYTVSSG